MTILCNLDVVTLSLLLSRLGQNFTKGPHQMGKLNQTLVDAVQVPHVGINPLHTMFGGHPVFKKSRIMIKTKLKHVEQFKQFFCYAHSCLVYLKEELI